jgi:hypothetical protein
LSWREARLTPVSELSKISFTPQGPPTGRMAFNLSTVSV